jgi:peroxiredoxin Q/BCP
MGNVKSHVTLGDKAPEFATLDDTGSRVSLSDFKGKWVVLFFYPKDDSPG